MMSTNNKGSMAQLKQEVGPAVEDDPAVSMSEALVYHRDYRRRGMPVGPCRDCGTEQRLNVGNRLCGACDKRRRRAADPDLRTRERLQRFLQAQLRREAEAAAQVAAERRARKNATNARYRARVALAAHWRRHGA